MKNIHSIQIIGFFFALLFSASQISAQSDAYHIKVKVKNLKDTVAYLGYYYGEKQYVKDTSRVVHGLTEFKGSESLDQGLYFFYAPANNAYFDVIVGKDQVFELETDTVDYVAHLMIKGSEENQLLKDYKMYLADQQKKASLLRKKLEEAGSDEAKAAPLKQEMMQINENVKHFQDQFVKEHPESMVSTIINLTLNPEVPQNVTDKAAQYYYYRDHFWDKVDFSDSRILRTPVFHSKVMEYIDKLTLQHPDSLSGSAQLIIDKSKDEPDVFRYLVVTLTSKYESSDIMGMDKVFVDLAENYYLNGMASWADSTVMANIADKVKKTKPNLIGKTAANMVLYDTLMRPMRIPASNKKFTLLCFFSPDCGHCKKVTPKLQQIAPSLKDKGVEVIAVCTEVEMDKLKKFVKEYKISFPHYADLRYQREPYNIESTPMIYILDKDNKIIAKRLDVEKVEGFIDHQLKLDQM
jgi:thiol-disulfide isomerase/thioredoxin